VDKRLTDAQLQSLVAEVQRLSDRHQELPVEMRGTFEQAPGVDRPPASLHQ